MEWISVKERLPDVANVIASYRFGIGEVKFFEGKFRVISSFNTEVPDVTHWMYLPLPPKNTKDK